MSEELSYSEWLEHLRDVMQSLDGGDSRLGVENTGGGIVCIVYRHGRTEWTNEARDDYRGELVFGRASGVWGYSNFDGQFAADWPDLDPSTADPDEVAACILRTIDVFAEQRDYRQGRW